MLRVASASVAVWLLLSLPNAGRAAESSSEEFGDVVGRSQARAGLLTFYADVDHDGFGDPATTTQACQAPTGYVTDSTD